ncbi:hypothetical protein ATANTOWER_013247 [Ataeniobius toweri]|uniref:Uncharacterized protein n=1 Tax=Ataeniobius toweri TaxID=208326 RepID=A0ABU7A625_9TELE|nr:hypothetical protein [Ataeniobius toweri]
MEWREEKTCSIGLRGWDSNLILKPLYRDSRDLTQQDGALPQGFYRGWSERHQDIVISDSTRGVI